MGNAFVHVELNTDDVGQAKDFYKKLFKWKLQDMNMGPGMTYTMIQPGEGTGGGMQRTPMPNVPPQWLPYVQVDDVASSIDKARKLGAQILVDKIDVPETGSIGIFLDPACAALGVWQPMKMARKTAGGAKKVSAKSTAGRKAGAKVKPKTATGLKARASGKTKRSTKRTARAKRR